HAGGKWQNRNRGGSGGGGHGGQGQTPPAQPSNAPANAPTGPKNAGKPGANYRGGGRGGNRGWRPYCKRCFGLGLFHFLSRCYIFVRLSTPAFFFLPLYSALWRERQRSFI